MAGCGLRLPRPSSLLPEAAAPSDGPAAIASGLRTSPGSGRSPHKAQVLLTPYLPGSQLCQGFGKAVSPRCCLPKAIFFPGGLRVFSLDPTNIKMTASRPVSLSEEGGERRGSWVGCWFREPICLGTRRVRRKKDGPEQTPCSEDGQAPRATVPPAAYPSLDASPPGYTSHIPAPMESYSLVRAPPSSPQFSSPFSI